jgi:hypothetical protein
MSEHLAKVDDERAWEREHLRRVAAAAERAFMAAWSGGSASQERPADEVESE